MNEDQLTEVLWRATDDLPAIERVDVALAQAHRVRRRRAGLAVAAAVAAVAGLGWLVGPGTSGARELGPLAPLGSPSGTVTDAPTPSQTGVGAPENGPLVGVPCDPHGGFPEPCPLGEPVVGLVSVDAGTLTVQPLRVLTDDAEGRRYAREHGLDFPFPNNYHQVPVGAARTFSLQGDTVCTGIMVVGYREPLEDHVVPCGRFVEALAGTSVEVTSALWFDGDRLVQLSELYRP